MRTPRKRYNDGRTPLDARRPGGSDRAFAGSDRDETRTAEASGAPAARIALVGLGLRLLPRAQAALVTLIVTNGI
jgi:hypothetical protein